MPLEITADVYAGLSARRAAMAAGTAFIMPRSVNITWASGMPPSIQVNVFARHKRRFLEIEHRADNVRDLTHPRERMELGQHLVI